MFQIQTAPEQTGVCRFVLMEMNIFSGLQTSPPWLSRSQQETGMYRRSQSSVRNKLDLSNPVQVRVLRKRLKVSGHQLASAVQTRAIQLPLFAKRSVHAIYKRSRFQNSALGFAQAALPFSRPFIARSAYKADSAA
jgi:hypothetical protein